MSAGRIIPQAHSDARAQSASGLHHTESYAFAAAIRDCIAASPRKKEYQLLPFDLDLEMVSARLLVDVIGVNSI